MQILDAEVFTLEGERLAPPHPFQDLKRFVQPLGPNDAVGFFVHLRERTIVECSKTDGQHEAAAGQMVQGHRFLSYDPRTSPRQGGNHRSDRDSGGVRSYQAESDPGIAGRAETGIFHPDRQRVPNEHSVPTNRFGVPSKLGQQARIREETDVG
jgi:hypothetical protein